MMLTKVRNALSLRWLAGPILGKEFRVLSRLKRSYLLRALYLLILMLFMSIVWFEATRTFNYSVFQASRMSEASEVIVTGIVWFQFIAAQILALILCSTAINQELVQRTLPALMTTPITSFQIIMGKLLSRLWQIAVLLAVSLPLLAMVRVFGGIPWMYVVAAFSITLSLVLFVCAMTIFFSALFKRAYVVMIVTVIALAVIFAVIPVVIMLLEESFPHSSLTNWLADRFIFYVNPYLLLAELTDDLSYLTWQPVMGQSPLAYWPCQFIILTVMSLLALWASCLMTRKAALRHLVAKTQRVEYKMPPRRSKTYWLYRPFFLHSMVKRTIGTGLIWKEFLQPVLGKFRKAVFVSLIVLVVGFVVGSLTALTTGGFGLFRLVVSGSVLGLLALSVLFTIIIPATSITAEKEAGTWLVLLTTCYSDYGILGGKLVGIARRIVVVWSPFLFIGALAAYVSDGRFAIYCWLIAAVAVAAGFVAASGLYFSSRFARSNTAVICNLALAAVLWVAIPFVLFALHEIFRDFHSYMMDMLNVRFDRLYWMVTVPGAIGTILERAHRYRPGVTDVQLLKASAAFFITHFIAIAFFLWRAKASLRRRIA